MNHRYGLSTRSTDIVFHKQSCGTTDAETKVSSSSEPRVTGARSEYSFACFGVCQEKVPSSLEPRVTAARSEYSLKCFDVCQEDCLSSFCFPVHSTYFFPILSQHDGTRVVDSTSEFQQCFNKLCLDPICMVD